jgi:hypothetical protein
MHVFDLQKRVELDVIRLPVRFSRVAGCVLNGETQLLLASMNDQHGTCAYLPLVTERESQ